MHMYTEDARATSEIVTQKSTPAHSQRDAFEDARLASQVESELNAFQGPKGWTVSDARTESKMCEQ